jgi:hypothetical protein
VWPQHGSERARAGQTRPRAATRSGGTYTARRQRSTTRPCASDALGREQMESSRDHVGTADARCWPAMVCVWSHQQQRILVSGQITGSASAPAHSSRRRRRRRRRRQRTGPLRTVTTPHTRVARPQARSRHRRRIRPQRRVRRPAASRVAALPALRPRLTQLEFAGSLGRCDTETHVFLSTYYMTQPAYLGVFLWRCRCRCRGRCCGRCSGS